MSSSATRDSSCDVRAQRDIRHFESHSWPVPHNSKIATAVPISAFLERHAPRQAQRTLPPGRPAFRILALHARLLHEPWA